MQRVFWAPPKQASWLSCNTTCLPPTSTTGALCRVGHSHMPATCRSPMRPPTRRRAARGTCHRLRLHQLAHELPPQSKTGGVVIPPAPSNPVGVRLQKEEQRYRCGLVALQFARHAMTAAGHETLVSGFQSRLCELKRQHGVSSMQQLARFPSQRRQRLRSDSL